MPKRTAKGYAVLRHTLGFKRFIDESEKHRAQFAERKNIFSEYLPYAVVFGATEKWAQAFAGLGDEPPDTSSWYVSQHAFNYAVFSSAIDGFAVTSAGTLTSSPPSSGFERVQRRRLLRRRWRRGRRRLLVARRAGSVPTRAPGYLRLGRR